MTPSPLFLPLNADESARLYWELARRGAFCDGESRPWKYEDFTEEELHVLAILQSRYDPRLMAILVDYFQKPLSLDPLRFKHLLRQYQALGPAAVIGEFVLSHEISQEVRDLFQFLAAGMRSVPTQLYYRGLYPLAGVKMREAVDRPLWAFKKWGFLASDPPFLKERKSGKRVFLFDLPSRLEILRTLSKNRERFRLQDYLRGVGFSISRQQALKDLKAASWIRKRGKGKGTYYFLAGSGFPTI